MQTLLVLSEPESTSYNAKRDLYQEVTNKIIALIERGVAPWRRTWGAYGLARNYATGHIYTGINFILMNNTEHPIPYFMTYNQIKHHGGQIRPGAKAEMVIYFNVVYKDSGNLALSQEDAQVRIKKGEDIQIQKFIKYYNVFGVDDIKGVEFKAPEVVLQPNEKIERCEDIIDNMPNRPGIKCIDANRAFYAPVQDFVNIPDIKQFESAEDYYASFFHELILNNS